MYGRERTWGIGRSGAAGWGKATKPLPHNLTIIAQELLVVNRLFKLSDLLGIGFFKDGGFDGMVIGMKRRKARLASRVPG
jgi:hypothetical protein